MKKKKYLFWLIFGFLCLILTILACDKLSQKVVNSPAQDNQKRILPFNIEHQAFSESTITVEPVDTVKPPTTLFRPFTTFPTGWKFPFCGSWQISCGYGCSKYHQGNDFYAIDWNLPGWSDYGQSIPAPASGYVRASYWDDCAGNVVVVDAGDGWLYRIIHMKSRYVSAGNWVNLGSYLGECGNTGWCCDGSHIHFAVYYPAVWAGYIKPIGTNQWGHGISVPQNGISGQWNLVAGNYYPSYQSCQCGR